MPNDETHAPARELAHYVRERVAALRDLTRQLGFAPAELSVSVDAGNLVANASTDRVSYYRVRLCWRSRHQELQVSHVHRKALLSVHRAFDRLTARLLQQAARRADTDARIGPALADGGIAGARRRRRRGAALPRTNETLPSVAACS